MFRRWSVLCMTVACSSSPTPDAPDALAATNEPAEVPSSSTVPIPATAAGRLAIGHARACLARAEGSVVCWGRSMTNDSIPAEPTTVRGLADIVQIAGGDSSWCARRKDGVVLCWEDGGEAKPIGVTKAVDLSIGCAVIADGSVSCWQEGSVAPLPEIHGAKTLGRDTHPGAGYAVLQDGSVLCWGRSYLTKTCDGLTLAEGAADPGQRTVKQVSQVDQVDNDGFVGGACAVAHGGLWCWGGEHGKEPVQYTGLKDVAQVAVGEYHTCVRHTNGSVTCVGFNDSDQLGDPKATKEDTRGVPAVKDVVEVRVGGGEPCGGCGSTCVRTKSDDILCWGQLNGSPVPKPVDVASAR